MNSRHLRLLPAAAAAAALIGFLAGCESGSSQVAGPVLPDISSPQRAIVALEDAYGERKLSDALYLHHPDFRYVPDPASQVPFLEPGETSWDMDRETAILERLLVPERISWLDQVLLEIDIDVIADSAGSPDLVIVRAGGADLLLLRGQTELLQGRSDLELVYLRDEDGNHFLLEVREAQSDSSDAVSEVKSLVEDPPTVETLAASDVTNGAAKLNGTANAMALPTTVWFEWGPDTSYGNVTPDQDGGEAIATNPYEVTLIGLTADTEYHYRIVARSEWGTSRGDDVTFTTAP